MSGQVVAPTTGAFATEAGAAIGARMRTVTENGASAGRRGGVMSAAVTAGKATLASCSRYSPPASS